MKISEKTFADRGDLDKERVGFKALVDLDLKYYVILDTRFASPTSISALQKTCYWPAPKPIKAGEKVVIYTRSGTNSTETVKDGICHFIFRGLTAPLYTDERTCAVVLEVGDWMTIGGGFPQ